MKKKLKHKKSNVYKYTLDKYVFETGYYVVKFAFSVAVIGYTGLTIWNGHTVGGNPRHEIDKGEIIRVYDWAYDVLKVRISSLPDSIGSDNKGARVRVQNRCRKTHTFPIRDMQYLLEKEFIKRMR